MQENPRLVLRFLYPDPILFPNKKASWQAKMLATRQARSDAYIFGLAQGGQKDDPLNNVSLEIIWHPSNKRVVDWDSLFRATKPIIDGGLIDAGFIQDDSPKVIKRIMLSIGNISKEPFTEIIIKGEKDD